MLPLGAISTAGARLWAEGQQMDVKASVRWRPTLGSLHTRV